jgi:hypothetical protein
METKSVMIKEDLMNEFKIDLNKMKNDILHDIGMYDNDTDYDVLNEDDQ